MLPTALTAWVTPAARTTSGGAEGVSLRVIANDDTEDHEVQRLLHPPETAATSVDVGGLANLKNEIHRKIRARARITAKDRGR